MRHPIPARAGIRTYRGPEAFQRATAMLFAAALLLACVAMAWAQVAVPPLKSAVTDLTATLSAQQSADLDARLKAWAQQKGSQIAVLIVPTTQPEDIEQFSIRVAEAWKIGRKGTDDGVILVVAKNDRTVRIEVGYGLEGAIPDAIAKRVVEEIIVPKFRAGDFYAGLSEGVTAVMKLVEGEKLPPPSQSNLHRPGSGLDLNLVMALLVMLVVVNSVLGRIFGRFLGSALGSGGAGALVWLILGSLTGGIVVAALGFVMSLVLGGPRGVYAGAPGGFGRHGGMGGWGGGGFGGGGFGGGGFGGGGGGFGGGGASGRW